ncbi:MAG: hypothetical protein GEV06_09155 [Luteitalea sp.]|nr:hypothetical protein [Luteitalea sp.]
MMHGFFRSLGAVFAGFVVGLLLTLTIEAAGNLMYPWPPDLQPGDVEAQRAHVASLPPPALFVVLLAGAVGAIGGAWVAARFAGRAPMFHATIVGLSLFAIALTNMLVLSAHPGWFWVASVGVYVVGPFTGGWLATVRSSEGTLAPSDAA